MNQPDSAETWRAISQEYGLLIDAARAEAQAYVEELQTAYQAAMDDPSVTNLRDMLLYVGSVALRVHATHEDFSRTMSRLRVWATEDTLAASYALDQERNSAGKISLQGRSWEEKESVYKLNQVALVRCRDMAKATVDSISEQLDHLNNASRALYNVRQTIDAVIRSMGVQLKLGE